MGASPWAQKGKKKFNNRYQSPSANKKTQNHAEQKIFGDIANDLDKIIEANENLTKQNIKAYIHAEIEQRPCSMCVANHSKRANANKYGVIIQFSKEFPNIEIFIRDMEENSFYHFVNGIKLNMNVTYKYTPLDIDLLGTYGSIATLTALLERHKVLFSNMTIPYYIRQVDNLIEDYWHWLINRPGKDESYTYYYDNQDFAWSKEVGIMGADYFYYTYLFDLNFDPHIYPRGNESEDSIKIFFLLDIQLFNLTLLESYDEIYHNIKPKMNANTADVQNEDFFEILKMAVHLADNPQKELEWQHRLLDKVMDKYVGVPYWELRIEKDFFENI